MGDVADVTGQRPAEHEGRNGYACDFEGLVIGCRPGRLLGRLCAKRCRRSAKRRLCEVLERAGFEVLLVSPRLTKQNSARKSDVPDCQWIWQLHFCSWLGFAPGTRVSDGKALAGRAPKTSPPSANSALHASGGHRRNQTTGATNGKPWVPAGQSWRRGSIDRRVIVRSVATERFPGRAFTQRTPTGYASDCPALNFGPVHARSGWQEWRDSNPQPPVLETGALAN